MAAIPVTLLDRPPVHELATEEVPQIATPPIGPEEFEVIFDTDTLVVACSCSSSSDSPYN